MKINPDIPKHTKIGIRVTAIIIIILTVMILKNCSGSFFYGIRTDNEVQQQYYEKGLADGSQKAQGLDVSDKPQTDNPLLRKTYHKGFREGWDSQKRTVGK